GLGAIMDRVWSVRDQLMLHVMTEDPARMAAYESQIAMLDGEIAALLAQYRQSDMAENEARWVDEFDRAWKDFQAAREAVLANSRRGYGGGAEQLLFGGHADEAFQKALQALRRLVDVNREIGAQLNQSIVQTDAEVNRTALAVSGLSLLVGIVFSMAMIRSITRPLGVLAEAAHRVADADLTRRAWEDQNPWKDEIGRLYGAF